MTRVKDASETMRAVPTDFNPNRAPLVDGPKIRLGRRGDSSEAHPGPRMLGRALTPEAPSGTPCGLDSPRRSPSAQHGMVRPNSQGRPGVGDGAQSVATRHSSPLPTPVRLCRRLVTTAFGITAAFGPEAG